MKFDAWALQILEFSFDFVNQKFWTKDIIMFCDMAKSDVSQVFVFLELKN